MHIAKTWVSLTIALLHTTLTLHLAMALSVSVLPLAGIFFGTCPIAKGRSFLSFRQLRLAGRYKSSSRGEVSHACLSEFSKRRNCTQKSHNNGGPFVAEVIAAAKLLAVVVGTVGDVFPHFLWQHGHMYIKYFINMYRKTSACRCALLTFLQKHKQAMGSDAILCIRQIVLNDCLCSFSGRALILIKALCA